MKRRHQLMAVAVVASAGLSIYGHLPSGGGVVGAGRARAAGAAGHGVDDGAAAAVAAASSPSTADKPHAPITIAALRPRAELMAHAASELFVAQTFDAPPPPPPPAPKPAPPASATAPPLPFAYLGKKLDNGHWEVYLADGDRTYFLREGSVVDTDYAVNSIRPPTLTLTYLPLKQMQTLSIGGAD